ncbi:hypothetical protein A0J61_00150 [Choanephora cucurbitarum]|uniref:Coth-domain-containing protein n=1 Tax=Choanephora cucurbitarum TaxID=101091 RepID=A0A1C7NRZ9_9FUNG|nr:hypothetical protein A0J61_00150 [Choanephora cucurbitarum]
MKLHLGYIGFLLFYLRPLHAADTEYSVIAFPRDQQNVNVIVDGQSFPLSQSPDSSNLYKGIAPSGTKYQYALTGGAGNTIEAVTRTLQAGIASTGNEFFNRSKTVHDIPPLPQAYNPIYPYLSSNMSRSNEISTIILEANSTGLGEILADPKGGFDYTLVSKITYISNKEIYTFSNAGIKNSGKSTKEFAKQSYKIKLNKFKQTGQEELLYGRTTFKLRAHETDPTFVREKLMLDILGASGVATVQGNYVRLFINNEPFGLYLMIDDSTTNFINIALNGGDQNYQHTGPTYKGNALNSQVEGNLAYKGDQQEAYNDTMYTLEDEGNMKKNLNKTNEKTPLIEFIKDLSTVDPTKSIDANTRGDIEKLVDPLHTMIHLALNFLSGSWDGIWHQASNYYLTKNTESNKWILITYDFDETFGLGAPSYMATTPYSNFSRPGSERPLVNAFISSPYYKSEFEKVLQTLIKRFFKTSVITPRVEAWKQMLREDVEWDLSLEPKSVGIKPQWTLWNFENNMNNTDGESMGVLEWINARSLAVQQQLNFNDVDDLPALESYVNKHQWDPNNYEKKDVKEKKNKADTGNQESGATIKSVSTFAISVVIFTVSYILL